MSESIIPSWQDAAERWKEAYDETQAENDQLRERVDRLQLECERLRLIEEKLIKEEGEHFLTKARLVDLQRESEAMPAAQQIQAREAEIIAHIVNACDALQASAQSYKDMLFESSASREEAKIKTLKRLLTWLKSSATKGGEG